MPTQEEQNITGDVPVRQGAVAGVASFLAGYTVTLCIVALTEVDDLTQDLLESSGIIYYNAQLADAEFTRDRGGSGLKEGFVEAFSGASINFVNDDTLVSLNAGTVTVETPSIVYYLVPILALVISGFLLARYVSAQTTQEGVLAGGTIVLGTLPLSLLGVFTFTIGQGGVELSPILSDSLVFVGILFPLIFGVIGGIIGSKTDKPSV